MRIAVAAHTPDGAGGVESYLARLLPALVRRGHDVACLFESAGSGRDCWVPRDGSVQVWAADAAAVRAVEALQQWQPDVVYAHGMRARALEMQVIASAPSVFFAHSYYGTCISGSKLHTVPHDRICTRVFGPGCLLQYYPRRCGGWSPLAMRREYGLQRDRRTTLHACGRLAVASQHMAQEYARHGFGEKVRIVHLPVTVRPSVRDRVSSGAARLLYLGRLERTKGVDQLIPAAAIAARALGRPVHLQISGKGTLSTQLAKGAARPYPNLTVTTTGWLSREGCEEALAGADLLLLPGRWPEPFGLSGLEAAASGVPAVAFDAGGIRDWLTDGVNGRLVPTNPPDVRRFAEAIVDCLRDGPRFTRFQQQARMAAARFTMAAHLAALERLFDEIVATAHPTPNAEPRTPSAERRTPGPERRTPSPERRSSSP